MCTRVLGMMTLSAMVALSGAARPQSATSLTSVQEQNDRFVREITASITGHEHDSAAQVFKNIQLQNFKALPAATILVILNQGYARALGVACTYCHDEQDFSSDAKQPKLAAREMAAMHTMINQQLRAMQHLDVPPDRRAINCSTCHRGAVNPLGT
jgi:Photosynthetic reaction centre cytochrome C subunit